MKIVREEARDFWLARIHHYSVVESKEKNPNIKIAASKALDEAGKQYIKVYTDL
jgi:hypothetical protein